MQTGYEEIERITKEYTIIKTGHINLSIRDGKYYVEMYESGANTVTVEVMFNSEEKARQMFNLLQIGQIFFDRSEDCR